MRSIFGLVLCSLICSLVDAAPYCANGWRLFGSNCYYVVAKQSYSFLEARNNCHQYRNADIVTIYTAAEQNFIESLKIEVRVWIGLHRDRSKQGYHYKWNDNKFHATYFNWNSGEPNDSGGNEDCTEIKVGGKWNDLSCSGLKLGYVCKTEALDTECIKDDDSRGLNYKGTMSFSKSGFECQAWLATTPNKPDSQYIKPESFPNEPLENVKNYCRVPINAATKNVSHDKPWCYVIENGTRWDECHISKCSQVKCMNDADSGWSYIGKMSTTVSGRTCQSWSVDTPHKRFGPFTKSRFFVDKNLARAGNYCRNPMNNGEPEHEKPWCYTTDPDKRWEFCNVPKCFPVKCMNDADKGWSYIGNMSTTMSGRTCQSWSVDTPHKRFKVYKNPKYFADKNLTSAGNYCRNPIRPRLGVPEEEKPWCYTTDPDKRWEFCNVPKCNR